MHGGGKGRFRPVRRVDAPGYRKEEASPPPAGETAAFSQECILIIADSDSWSVAPPKDGDWGSLVLEPGHTDAMTPFETDDFGFGWPHSFRRRF